MKNLILPVIFLFALLTCCCTKKETKEEQKPTYEPNQMLTNIYDNIIVVGFDSLSRTSDSLNASVIRFADNPTSQNLQSAKQNLVNTWKKFQHITPFMFGPSDDGISTLNNRINVFPVNATKIENSISGGNFTFNDFNYNVRGFGAIDYLLYHDSEANIIAQMTSNRKNYIKAVALDIKTRVTNVKNSWNNFRSNFVNDSETGISSNFTQLFNTNIQAFESIKNFKLGLPLGLRIGQTTTEPNQVEAFYSGISNELIYENIIAIENVWNGKNGQGFDDILATLGNNTLKTNTENQFQAIKTAYLQIPNSKLSDLITNGNSTPNGLFNAMASHTRYIKSELSSALNITITYSSNDGD